jgi:hypothetical protein
MYSNVKTLDNAIRVLRNRNIFLSQEGRREFTAWLRGDLLCGLRFMMKTLIRLSALSLSLSVGSEDVGAETKVDVDLTIFESNCSIIF